MSLFGPWSEHVEERSWTADGGLSLLKVRSLNGSIVVRGADQEEIMVRAVTTVRAPTEGAARQFARRVLVSRTRIRDGFYVQAVYPRPPLGCTVFVRLEITVPWMIDVDLFTHNGGVTVSGVEGAVEVETRSGNVDLVDTMGPATLYTAAGTIRAKGVDGAIEAENGQGQIVVEACSGHIRARTARGGISMAACEGSIRARTYQGDIQLLAARGGADLETADGHIHATFDDLKAPAILQSDRGSVHAFVSASEAYLEAEALDGNVAVKLPADYAGMLDAGTAGGIIACALPIEAIQQSPILLTGRLGDGVGPLVKLRTFGGSISIGAMAGGPTIDDGRSTMDDG